MKKYLLSIIDESGAIVGEVPFVDNLTCYDAPDYVNLNGQLGITRLEEGKYEGQLVFMQFYEDQQDLSYAEFVSENEAYRLCASRNKLDLAYSLNIHMEKEVEVL